MAYIFNAHAFLHWSRFLEDSLPTIKKNRRYESAEKTA